MTATKIILAKLNEIFAPMDAQVVEGTKVWAADRKAAVKEFQKSDECKALGLWSRHDRLHQIAGGVTWFRLFETRSQDGINEFVEKNCAKIAEKRNASIAAKLDKAGVSEVISEEFTRTTDGFNGVFVVNTNAGRKSVRIETIMAGGYNIQCLHMRVLTKVA